MVRRRPLLATLAALPTALAGCGTGSRDESTTGDDDGDPSAASDGVTVTPNRDTSPARPVGYTHVRPSGNRLVGGRGSVPDSDPLTYDPGGTPTWLAAVPGEEGSHWAVATAGGRVDLLTVRDGSLVENTRTDGKSGDTPTVDGQTGDTPAVDGRSGDTPPVVALDDGPSLLDQPSTASQFSHPVVVDERRRLFVDRDGALVLHDGDDDRRAQVDALSDARPVRVAPGRYALLAGRTDRYAHGALGDRFEASRVVVADVRDGLAVETVVDLDAPTVIEGIAPIAANLTGDDAHGLVVTLADGNQGGRLAVYATDGTRVATGPGFGTGSRWRHQLAVGPFGPNGERELAAVETPHIGGTARFHRLDGSTLDVVGSVGGVSSHSYGSRNLDGAIAGDLDGDGAVELLVPNQSRDELVAVRRTTGGAEEAWRLDVGGEVRSNLTGVALADGSLAVGAGGSDGTVRIWHP